MGNRTFTTTVDNYNYSKEDVSVVQNREYNYFNMDVTAADISTRIRLVIRSSTTKYNHVYDTTTVQRVKIMNPRYITLDDARLVQLGGTFEKIGDKDESIGGGDQKVGEADK